MFRTITLIIVLTATSAVVVGSGPATADTPHSGSYRSSRIVEPRPREIAPSGPETLADIELLSDDEQILVDWARDRFADAGLELPDVTVRFDPSKELCGNAEGLYHHEADGERVVTICARESDSFAAQLYRRRTLLHELGHAWDFANLTAEDHDELGRVLGAESWNDSDDVWADRGVESFAETFVFALLDQSARQLKVSIDCADLLSAFSGATGALPLGPGLPPCAA